jgi:hypothetical protein
MTIEFTELVEVEVLTADGQSLIQKFHPNQTLEVKHVRNNRSFNTSTILLEDGSTIHGVSQMTFEIL